MLRFAKAIALEGKCRRMCPPTFGTVGRIMETGFVVLAQPVSLGGYPRKKEGTFRSLMLLMNHRNSYHARRVVVLPLLCDGDVNTPILDL